MSSGFTSGGTLEAPTERSDEWLAAQQELEAVRAKKAEEARRQDGKSLFETLEANKAAKEEAFLEASKLKNQFRALDEDEIEFLDSVLESTRKEELRIKKETAEGLALFRRQQEDADKLARGEVVGEEETEEGWTFGGAGKKRKRKGLEREGVLKGVKVRRQSMGRWEEKARPMKREQSSAGSREIKKEEGTAAPTNLASKAQEVKIKKEPDVKKVPEIKKESPEVEKKPEPPKKGGLVDYGSDEDDDW